MGLQWTILRFIAMRMIEVGVVIAIIFLLPNVPPYTTYQKSYKVTPPKPLEGTTALNEKLNDVELWHLNDFKGPEAFAEYNGELYTSLDSGDIVKLTGDKHITPVVKFGKPCKYYESKICGRPLGIKFDKNGNLYAADAYYGIFKVNVKTGEKVQIVSPEIEINGKAPKLFNNVAILSSGDIYWSDSSTDFTLEDGAYDILADGSGRLVHYDPKTKKNKVVIDDLHFANGLAVSENEDFLLISETGRSRIHRYYLKGPKAGTYDLFIDGLPGQPDNLTPDGHGGFFVPLYMSHTESLPNPAQMFGPFPKIRKVISRLMALFELVFMTTDRLYPNEYSKIGIHLVGSFESVNFVAYMRHSTILRVNDKGEIIDSYHCTNHKIATISEAFIYKDQLLLGSPYNDFIGRVPLKDIGIKTRVVREAPPPPTPKVETPPPTQKPVTTPKPTQKVETQKPTQKVETPKPTQAPTQAPTQKPKVESPKTTVPTTQKPKVETPPPTQKVKVEAPKPAQKVQAPKVEAAKPKVKVEPAKPALKVDAAKAKEAPKPAQKVNAEAKKPVETAKKPVETAKKPVAAAKKPVEAAKKPVEAVKKPVETAKKPVETAKKPVEAVKKPAAPNKVEAGKVQPKKEVPPPSKVPQTPPPSVKAPAVNKPEGKVPGSEKPNPKQ